MAVIKDSPSRKVFNVVNYTLLLLLTLSCIVPIVNLLAISLSSDAFVGQGKVGLFPKGFTLDAYEHITGNKLFLQTFWNSIVIVVLGVTYSMTMTVLGAYPMSRDDRELKGRKFYVWFMVITLLFGGGLLPTFMTIKFTGLMNTIWALIIPGVPVFAIFMLMHFFRGLPREVEESAFMDGASYLQVLWKIYIPMAVPAIATLVLFSFVGFWNEYFKGLIYLNNKEDYPLQTYLYTIMTSPDLEDRSLAEIKKFANMNPRTIVAAQIFVAMIPVMIIYPFLQKYFTKGIVLGSVKG
jgi:putative aldouronate transport system permease protein